MRDSRGYRGEMRCGEFQADVEKDLEGEVSKETDAEYEDVTIEKVEPQSEGWSITRSDGWSFFVPDKGVEPRVGDSARFYGRGIGNIVRGLDIAGREVFYRTPKEQEDQNKRDLERMAQEKVERFEKNKSRLDGNYASLPSEFQSRLDGLRERNPEFRWEYESYEMMVCVDAVKIAKGCADAETGEVLRRLGIRVKDGEWSDTPTGRLRAFGAINSAVNDYQYELQEQVIPGLSDGHSGNSFAAAMRLAYLYLEQPDLVAKEHGALCPLVGCDDYGCYSLTQSVAA